MCFSNKELISSAVLKCPGSRAEIHGRKTPIFIVYPVAVKIRLVLIKVLMTSKKKILKK